MNDGTRIFYKTPVPHTNVRHQTRRSDAHLMNSDFMTLRFFPHMTSGKSFRRMIWRATGTEQPMSFAISFVPIKRIPSSSAAMFSFSSKLLYLIL